MRSGHSRAGAGLLAFILAVVCSAPAAAVSTEWTLAPYAWVPGLSGSLAFAGFRVPLQLGANPLLKGVNTGGMGYARWQRERRFAYAEGIFMSFGDRNFAPFFGQSIDARLRFGELGGGLVLRRTWGRHGPVSFWPYAGLRYTRIGAHVSGALLAASAANQWTDPVAGLVVEVPLAARLALIAKADAGGLAISTNEYYNALGVVNWQLRPNLSLDAGFRWAKAHYRSSGLNFDLYGRGPLVGFQYTMTRS